MLQMIEDWATNNKVTVTNLNEEKYYLEYLTTSESNFIPNIRGRVSMRSALESLKLSPVSMNKEDINSAIREYLSSNNVDMLNNYEKITNKIEVKSSKGFFKGFIGEIGAGTLLNRIKDNKSFEPQMSIFDKDTQSAIVKRALDETYCELIGSYIDSRKRIKFKVKDGKYKGLIGEVLLQTLKRGYSIEFESLTDESKKEFFQKTAESRGYRITELPKDLKKTNRVKLMTSQNNAWEPIWSMFEHRRITFKIKKTAKNKINKSGKVKKSKRSLRIYYRDTYNMSLGERIVYAILKENKISFISEYPCMTTNGEIQRMDFYLVVGSRKICVEFHGIQHYEESKYFKNDLKTIQTLDKNKKEYCIKNNIEYFEISYLNKSIADVFNELNKIIEIENKPNQIDIPIYKNTKRKNERLIKSSLEILEYYKNNSYRKTYAEMGISSRTLNNIMDLYNFKKKKVI